MKPVDVRKQIKAGETGPLYLLEGDDPQSRHDLAMEFASVVDEGLQAFNVQNFHANEATTASARDLLIGDLLAAARTLPMMAPRRVLIVLEADRILSPRKAREEDAEPALAFEPSEKKRKRASLTPLEELEQYFESPEPLSTVVFVAGDLDANRRLVKLLRSHAVAVDCGSLDTPAEASKWIQRRLEKDNLTIEPRAVSLLLESTGLSLGRIRAEVEKIVLYAAGDKAVTPRHIKELILPQSEPGKFFVLGDAIARSDPAMALRELSAQLDAGSPPPLVLGQIRWAVGRLKPDARARSGIDAIFRTDLAIKSSAGEPRYLLERLVVELCGRPV